MEGNDPGLEARVLETIWARAMVSPGDKVLIAVSGGADSVALLFLLSALSAPLGISLAVAHYEHGIRGEDSLADARFVAGCSKLVDVPFYMGRGDVPAFSRQWRCSLEDAARRARYAFLNETATAVGADRIALAHQLEDQAETLLLHLVHGSGLRGLGGMRFVQGNRIRPLLDIPRQALEDYLLAKGIRWREDETNRDTVHARNLLRHEVFPILRRLNPRVTEAMARTAGLAQQAADALGRDASRALCGRVKAMPYGAFWLVGLDGMTPESVRLFAEQAGVPQLDSRQTAEVLALVAGGLANLPGGWKALRTRERLHLLRERVEPVAVSEDEFTWSGVPPDQTGDGIRVQAFDAELLQGAVFRTRRDGDLFAPLGMEGTQKLKRTLQDAGVDRPFRDLLPVLANGSRVLWIVGLKAGRDAAIGADTRRAVQVEYHGDLPWEISDKCDGGTKDD